MEGSRARTCSLENSAKWKQESITFKENLKEMEKRHCATALLCFRLIFSILSNKSFLFLVPFVQLPVIPRLQLPHIIQSSGHCSKLFLRIKKRKPIQMCQQRVIAILLTL